MSTERPPPADGPAAGVHEFLRSLERRVQSLSAATPLPEALTALREVGAGDDLAAHFLREARDAGWHVHRATEQDWLTAVAGIVRECGAQTVVVEPLPGSALPPERAAALSAALTAKGVTVVTERDDESLFGAEAAVTGAFAAIAETGTVVCASGPATARGTSLVAPVHVALVSVAQLVGDSLEFFEQLGRRPELPANVNLITGPSKTADIEGILVTGVHGPGQVHVVLLD